MRLQKFLAHCGVCSRRAAEELIAEGRVRVNQEVVSAQGEIIDTELDTISVDGRIIEFENKKLFLFNKPKGVVSTLSDPHNKKDLKKYIALTNIRAFPVGRLDRDAFGLMLLTNDGEFANTMMHPSFEIERTYYLLVKGQIGKNEILKAKNGIELIDGWAKAKIENLKYNDSLSRIYERPHSGQSIVKVTVIEGRKHLVKRILKKLGAPVIELCRFSHGKYKLDNLRPGQILEVKNYQGTSN